MTEGANSYEAQQAQLRRQEEGAGDEDLTITAPQMPEVNPEVYKDVEPILFRGFLHTSASINGVPFVFKSFNRHEFDLLSILWKDGGSREIVNRNYDLFLAYGVTMIDGVNVLGDRDRWVRELADVFHSLVDGARTRVIYRMSELNRRASRAVQLVEAYTMEQASRFRWHQYQGLELSSPAVTGLKGTQDLGLNWGQLTWRALNLAEDKKERYERDWENAKFVAGSMAGKGMNKIHSADKRRHQQERDDKLARRDKIIRLAVFGEDVETTTRDGAPMQVARTVEELADQLERDLKGEQDWHDKVVAAHEEQQRRTYEERAQEIAALYQKNRERFGDGSLIGSTDMEGLSPQEVQWRIAHRRQLVAQKMAAAQVYPELHDPKVQQFNQRWFNQKLPAPGGLNPQVTGPKGLPFKPGDE